MELDKSLYDTFVDLSPQGSLFHKSWWLDAAAPNQYRILFIQDSNGILAAWPIVSKRIMGLKIGMLPPLTPSLGIMFGPSRKAKYAEQLSEEMRLTGELIKLLPKHALFRQHFHYQFSNWLPFYWEGFKQTTRYTYVIEDLSNLDGVWENMRYSTKRKIQKANKLGIKIVTDLSFDQLLDLNELTFRRQGLPLPYSRDHVKRIHTACQKQGAGKMLFAVDSKSQIHAAVYLVYDHKSAYYLLGGGDPNLRNSNAQALLLWEAVKFAGTVSKSFDFEGSMHRNIEPIFRGFGGRQQPYLEISQGHPILRLGYTWAVKAWSKGGIPAYLIRRLIGQ